MVANIVWTVLSGLATLLLIGAVASFNVLPIKTLIIAALALILINVLISLLMFKTKRILRDLAMLIAFFMFVSFATVGSLATALRVSMNKMVGQENTIFKTVEVAEGESFAVYMKDPVVEEEEKTEAEIQAEKLEEAEMEKNKEAYLASGFSSEEVEEMFSNMVCTTYSFDVINPKTNEILEVYTTLNEELKDDKEIVSKLEEIYGIKFNYYVIFKEEILVETILGFTVNDAFADISSDSSTMDVLKVLPKVVKDTLKTFFDGFKSILNTDASYNTIKDVVKGAIDKNTAPKLNDFYIAEDADDYEQSVTKVKRQMKEMGIKVTADTKIEAEN